MAETNDNPELPVPKAGPGSPSWKRGRPKGVLNKLTRERYDFIEMVVGAQGSEERREFAQAIRKQFMDGSIAPAVATCILHWWLGKPKESIEVQHIPPDLSELSDEQLAERAKLVADVLKDDELVEAVVSSGPH